MYSFGIRIPNPVSLEPINRFLMKSLHVLPVKARSMKELEERIHLEAPHADILEIWLDSLHDLRLAEIFFLKEEVKKPFLFVNRAPFEGGEFMGTSKQRVAPLIEALERGSDWVDVPIQTESPLIKKVMEVKKTMASKIILSYHNFKGTPSLSELKKIVQDARKKGADLVKIATFAESMDDNVTLFELTKCALRKRIPLCTNAMGPKGEISRVICPILGSALYYAPLTEAHRTAPGQMTKAELHAVWSRLKIAKL